MGLAITTERLSVCAAGSMVSMRIALPVGTWVHFPTGERCHACQLPRMMMFGYSTVRQGLAIAGLLPKGLGDFVHFAGLTPVTIPFLAIVDDDEALCSSLVDLMCSIGYRAEAFASAETFLMSPNRFGLDCIIADVHMPGMGGLNLLRELHKQRIMTPVILITALPDEHLDEEAASRGALCLLRKPFETSCLLDRIERSLPK
jgi:CheY-like chemotaxis protein